MQLPALFMSANERGSETPDGRKRSLIIPFSPFSHITQDHFTRHFHWTTGSVHFVFLYPFLIAWREHVPFLRDTSWYGQIKTGRFILQIFFDLLLNVLIHQSVRNENPNSFGISDRIDVAALCSYYRFFGGGNLRCEFPVLRNPKRSLSCWDLATLCSKQPWDNRWTADVNRPTAAHLIIHFIQTIVRYPWKQLASLIWHYAEFKVT